MGQYYRPIILGKKKNKKGNEVIVNWFDAWDYRSGVKLMEHSYQKNPVVNAVINYLADKGSQRVVWAGDYADNEGDKKNDEDGMNLYSLAKKKTGKKSTYRGEFRNYKYLVNESKKLYVDLTKLPKDKEGYVIHPLPLLTCEGNDRGGGDFHGENKLIGTWARDVIGVSLKEGYEEIKPDFIDE